MLRVCQYAWLLVSFNRTAVLIDFMLLFVGNRLRTNERMQLVLLSFSNKLFFS